MNLLHQLMQAQAKPRKNNEQPAEAEWLAKYAPFILNNTAEEIAKAVGIRHSTALERLRVWMRRGYVDRTGPTPYKWKKTKAYPC